MADLSNFLRFGGFGSLPTTSRNALAPNTIVGEAVRNALLADVQPLGPTGSLLEAYRFEPEVPEGDRKLVAWQSARYYPGLDPARWRQDDDGHLIRWDDYGTENHTGWHIHHRLDQALGGRHTASNLVARYWRANVAAGGVLGALMKD